MNFDYSEEQQLLAASVSRFVDEQYDFDTRKKIIASSEGYSAGVWSGLADIGLLGLPLPVESGGFGGGAVDLLNVMIGYVTLGTNDLPRAAAFYDKLLAEIGAKRLWEFETGIACRRA